MEERVNGMQEETMEMTDGFGHSPFCYRQGMIMDLTNKKCFCSQREINKLIGKGFITEPDIQLMKTMYEHGYLSRKAASEIIRHDAEIVPVNKRKEYKNSFRKLVKMGALHRFLPTWGEDRECHSPCLYSLSAGASLYIERLYQKDASYFRHISRLAGDSPEIMLNSAVAGQFHGNVLRFRQEKVKKAYINYSFSVHKEKYLLPLLYKLEGEGLELDIAVMPVRTNEGHGKAAARLMLAVHALSKREGGILRSPIFVFVCENSSHARNLAVEIKKAGLGNMAALYCLDRGLMSGDVFKSMFTLGEEENGYVMQMWEVCV